jgi:hypothetical protein
MTSHLSNNGGGIRVLMVKTTSVVGDADLGS